MDFDVDSQRSMDGGLQTEENVCSVSTRRRTRGDGPTMNTIERKLLRDKMVLQDQKSLAKLDYPGVKLCGKVSDKIS